jgi:hypothetical protein
LQLFEIFSAFGLSSSAGLNAYIPLLVISLLAKFTNLLELDTPWNTLESWWIIGLLLVLSLIEFFADKAPAINHINDIIQTIIRPISGAIVFAASARVVTEINPVLAMACGLLIAGGVHAVKSLAVRPAVTATTGGAANTPVSILEDITATALSIMAVIVPVLVASLMIIITAYIIWALWRRANRQHAAHN